MKHRFISLDTETTGLDPHAGDRVIEIGLVEFVDRRPTGRMLHVYLNPDRPVDPEAEKVHGLSNEFLAKHKRFAEVVDEVAEFVGDCELVIHNAEFDLNFLNSELARCGRPPLDNPVLDTLEYVKRKEPGKRASLDAMADRYNIDRSDRTLHGALIDAKLLGEVYIAMTRLQSSLALTTSASVAQVDGDWSDSIARLVQARPSNEEASAHEAYLAALDKETGGNCIWLKAHSAAGTPALH